MYQSYDQNNGNLPITKQRKISDSPTVELILGTDTVINIIHSVKKY